MAFGANAQELCFEANSFISGSHPNQLIAADFTGDGIPDIASTSLSEMYNLVKISVGVGDGTFVMLQGNSFFPVGTQPLYLVTADFNDDGILDIATNNSTGANISILLGEGEGYFADAVNMTISSGEQYPKGIATGDFNNDGNIDLAVGGGNRKVGVFLGAGDGTFGAPTFTNVEVDSGIYFITVADINNDGNDDVITANMLKDTVSILLGNGAGGFATPIHIPVGDAPYSVTVAHIDGDDFMDLMVANFDADNVSVHRGIGDGSFVEPVSYPVSTPKSITVADFNGDSTPDLAVAINVGEGSVAVLTGSGNGTFNAAVDFEAGEDYPSTVITGDFNNDGKQDIISSNYNSGNDGQKNFTVFLNCMEPTAGTADFASNAMALYPNPASSQLNAQLPNGVEIQKATFYNTLGQKVMEAGSTASWNISALSSGLHFVTLETSHGNTQLKFIKE